MGGGILGLRHASLSAAAQGRSSRKLIGARYRLRSSAPKRCIGPSRRLTRLRRHRVRNRLSCSRDFAVARFSICSGVLLGRRARRCRASWLAVLRWSALESGSLELKECLAPARPQAVRSVVSPLRTVLTATKRAGRSSPPAAASGERVPACWRSTDRRAAQAPPAHHAAELTG